MSSDRYTLIDITRGNLIRGNAGNRNENLNFN